MLGWTEKLIGYWYNRPQYCHSAVLCLRCWNCEPGRLNRRWKLAYKYISLILMTAHLSSLLWKHRAVVASPQPSPSRVIARSTIKDVYLRKLRIYHLKHSPFEPPPPPPLLCHLRRSFPTMIGPSLATTSLGCHLRRHLKSNC